MSSITPANGTMIISFHMYASHSNGNSHVFSVFEEDLYVYNDDFIYVYIYIQGREREI